MKKTLFIFLLSSTLIFIGSITIQTLINTNSSVTNTHIKEGSTTNYTTEEIYIDYVYEGEMPEFPGRIAAYMKFIKKNMQIQKKQ